MFVVLNPFINQTRDGRLAYLSGGDVVLAGRAVHAAPGDAPCAHAGGVDVSRREVRVRLVPRPAPAHVVVAEVVLVRVRVRQLRHVLRTRVRPATAAEMYSH